MGAIGQKEAVIREVMAQLPTFIKQVDNALLKLSTIQLEAVKDNVFHGIIAGQIEYGKSLADSSEVKAYARSMVMNHLKKAKELNGGHGYSSNPASTGSTVPRTLRAKVKLAPKGINPDLLSEELKEFVKTLV